MNLFFKSFQLFKRRGTLYKCMVLGSGLAVTCLLFMVIPSLISASIRLMSRTPLGQSSLIQVEVTASHLSSIDQELITDRPQRVAIHQVTPELKLIGMAQSFAKAKDEEKHKSNSRLQLGIFPSEAQRILKADTAFSLRVQAPSIELLSQELYYSERGQKLQEELIHSRNKVTASWLELWPEVKAHLSRLLPSDLFSRLMKDAVFVDRLREAFIIEISSQIDLESLSKKLGESKALGELGSVAFKHVKWTKVLKEFGGGLWRGGKSFMNETSKTVEKEWTSGTILPDLSYCALSVSEVFAPRSMIAVIGSVFDLESSEVCSGIKTNAQHMLMKAGASSGLDLGKQVFGSLAQENEKASVQGLELLNLANQELKTASLLTNFWQALSQDQMLFDHIKKTYGEKAFAQIMIALKQLSRSEAVTKRISELNDEIKNSAQKGLKALLLDQTGTGPNPLLLAIIQEQLSGQQRAIIHVYPGQGQQVKSGHIFQHREEIQP